MTAIRILLTKQSSHFNKQNFDFGQNKRVETFPLYKLQTAQFNRN